MSNVKPYLVLIGITTLLSTATIAVMIALQPTMLQSLPKFGNEVPDSLRTIQQQNTVVASSSTDTVKPFTRNVNWEDTVAVLRRELIARDRYIAELKRQLEKNSAKADSARVARELQYAKLLEAMNPEEAAKVLSNFNDNELKSILLKIKTKQASKILASLEPKRAARIMK